MENIFRDNLLEQYNFNKDKLIIDILKKCHVVFDNLNEDGERNVYLLSDLEIDDKGIFSFLLTKDDLPISSHYFSIEEVYEFNELDKIIIREINS